MLCATRGLEAFRLYSTRVPEEVPETLYRHLELLARTAPCLGAVRLTGETSAVFLVNRFYTRRVKVRELPDVNALCENPLPERDAALAFLRWWYQ